MGFGDPRRTRKLENVRIRIHHMQPTASMEFLGDIVGGDRRTATTHRITEAKAEI